MGWHYLAARCHVARGHGPRSTAAGSWMRLAGRQGDRLGEREREAWGVGGWGMAAERRQSLRAVAGAEARTTCAYSRGFQIRA